MGSRSAHGVQCKHHGRGCLRKDLKPLQVIQPEGPSFKILGRRVEWQKWSFQLGWTLREGPVLHDVQYDGRPLFYRVSMSEMTVPYGDPRSPYHRKQAFDLGDSGFGLTSNSLSLGCDCLGHIAYFSGVRVTGSGKPVVMPNVVCMHEIDDGIGWKHTNFRNHKSSVVRNRQLVVQCTATVANYEYILAFVLDQAANLHVEVRATGIVSTMPIRQGIQVPWGSIVAPGVLAVNHQHIFCARVDPILDGDSKSTIAYDECHPVINEPDLDPHGCAFKVHTTPIDKPGGYELDITKNRTYKIINEARTNAVSGKPHGYKLHPVPSQMLMMGPNTFNFRRGIFTSKAIWVTKYQDDELWASGEFTNQSREDTGLAIWANREENVKNEDVVLWHSFGVTHVTRPEGKSKTVSIVDLNANVVFRFPRYACGKIRYVFEACQLLRAQPIQRCSPLQTECQQVDFAHSWLGELLPFIAYLRRESIQARACLQGVSQYVQVYYQSAP